MKATVDDILAHFDTEPELAHYGVKGMRWGVRKDRRKGTGRRRGDGSKKKKKKNSQETVSKGKSSGTKKKSSRRMNNEELRKATERLELETRYARAKRTNRRTTSVSGRMSGWVTDTTKDIVTDVTKSSFKKLGNEILAEALGIEPAQTKKKKKN